MLYSVSSTKNMKKLYLLQKQLTEYEYVFHEIKEELEKMHNAEILQKMPVVWTTVTGASTKYQ